MAKKYFNILLLMLLSPMFSAQAKVVSDSVHSASLMANRLRESPDRQALIYLPPNYESFKNKAYPVVYLLHSYGGHPASWLGKDGYEGLNIAETLDSLIVAGEVKPMLIVMPDAHTKFGGSWYTNSSTGGSWTDFIADDLVAHVDQHYRTMKDRHARGIAGQSMGGYGALLVAISRPHIFGPVLAMSPVNLINPDPFGKVAHEAALEVTEDNLASGHILGRLFWSKAIAFSPNPERPPFYADLPVHREDDVITRDEQVWRKWLSYALNSRMETDIEPLKRLQIRLEIGTEDPLLQESQTFSRTLAQYNIDHEFLVFQGGHVAGVRGQFESSVFQFFSEHFPQE